MRSNDPGFLFQGLVAKRKAKKDPEPGLARFWLSALTYQYDLANNRVNIRAEYSKSGGAGNDVQDNWYTYDNENRIVIAQGQLSGGNTIELAQGRGAKFTYNELGQRSFALSWLNSEDGLFNRGGYGQLNYRLHRYTYSDMGQLLLTEERFSNNPNIWYGGDANMDPDARADTSERSEYGEGYKQDMYGLRYWKKQERFLDDWGNVTELTEYMSKDTHEDRGQALHLTFPCFSLIVGFRTIGQEQGNGSTVANRVRGCALSCDRTRKRAGRHLRR